MNESKARTVLRQAESAANHSLSDVSLIITLREVQILPQSNSCQQIVSHRFPLQAKNVQFNFKMSIPVFAPDFPAPLSIAFILSHSCSSSSHMSPTISLIGLVRISRKRTCKGCGAITCKGRNNRRLCALLKCIKRFRSECAGLFDSSKSNAI